MSMVRSQKPICGVVVVAVGNTLYKIGDRFFLYSVQYVL